MRNLRGWSAIVTGASRGIGPYIGAALARRGVNLMLTARSSAELAKVAEGLAEHGILTRFLATDIADSRGLSRIVTAAEEAFGRVDLLVNNAGIGRSRAFHTLSPREIENTVRVNLIGAMLITRIVLPDMLKRGRGHIVNVSSLAGLLGLPYQAVYSASKAALVGFTQSLRSEYAGTGVSASAVHAGFITDAGMYARTRARTGIVVSRFLSSSADRVGAAVVRAVERDLPDVIVNPLPARPAIAATVLFPRIRGWLLRRFGVVQDLEAAARAAEGEGCDQEV